MQTLFGSTTPSKNPELFEALRAWRNEMALREGKEAYLVFQNEVLERTLEAMPQSIDDLVLIKGWGKKKIEKYGAAVLKIISGKQVVKEPEQKDSFSENFIEKKQNSILSVGQFIQLINGTLASLPATRIQGEIHEVGIRGGFAFFTLRDKDGAHSIGCFISGRKLQDFQYLLEDGMEVIISGYPSLYERNGSFRITVTNIEPVGEGALLKAFEALKAKLELKGYFDKERKRPLPKYIKYIGLVTSESGAAITDFRKNLGEYGFEIIFQDVRVEGEYAENSIAKAIRTLNTACPFLDVLIVIRGGGGLESLKAFNSERVAEAILLSKIPTLVGIGHEKDITIADFVADLTLSTPTAVAAFLRRNREELILNLRGTTDQISRSFEVLFLEKEAQLIRNVEILEANYVRMIERLRLTLQRTAERLHSGLGAVFVRFREFERSILSSLNFYESKTKQALHTINLRKGTLLAQADSVLQTLSKRLEVSQASLLPLDPHSILKRGYSVVYTSSGRVLKSIENAKRDDLLTTRISDGTITSRVEETKKQ